MATFVQLAVFGVVLALVVYRQTSTVVDTPQITLLWVWSDRVVEDMADKLFIMMGALSLIKRDLFTFSSGAVAPNLKSWQEYAKKLCNHHFIVFTPHLGKRCFSSWAFIIQVHQMQAQFKVWGEFSCFIHEANLLRSLSTSKKLRNDITLLKSFLCSYQRLKYSKTLRIQKDKMRGNYWQGTPQ